ncbi:hypothetical protein N7541_004624 [Penicillium brevicompactum]|uniref:Uncharacterized protein n=1 Tax=Penicillium brevicompactum TaxID=5074 RepID=A0A9W9RC79_PENBR|nr:hypothetical protein N7541_004624 [Penicillium brevicompactum]
MEPLQKSGHDAHSKNASRQSHILDSRIEIQDMQDPIEPGSTDVDERMTRDFKDAIDRTNILDGDRLRHAKPQSSTAYNEPSENEIDISWRPDPSGHPHRTF